jgi:prepilin-type N-terminal cleavage/methylation domain-containing protein
MLRPCHSRRGFTILELCIALVLVTLVATASIWAWFSRAEITLVKAADLLVEDLRLAQTHAIYLHAPVEVVFHPDATGYHVVLPEHDEFLPSAERPRSYPADAVFEGVRIQVQRLPDENRLVFDPRGRIERDASITLSFRGEARTILARADGTIRVADRP